MALLNYFHYMPQILLCLAFTFKYFWEAKKKKSFSWWGQLPPNPRKPVWTEKEKFGDNSEPGAFFSSLAFSHYLSHMLWSSDSLKLKSADKKILCAFRLLWIVNYWWQWMSKTLELLQKKLNKDTFAVFGIVFDEQLTFPMFTWVESLKCC